MGPPTLFAWDRWLQVDVLMVTLSHADYSETCDRNVGHHRDPAGCSVWSGIPSSEVDLYTAVGVWNCRQCPH